MSTLSHIYGDLISYLFTTNLRDVEITQECVQRPKSYSPQSVFARQDRHRWAHAAVCGLFSTMFLHTVTRWLLRPNRPDQTQPSVAPAHTDTLLN